MDTADSFDTVVPTYQTIKLHIPEDRSNIHLYVRYEEGETNIPDIINNKH
jgi:hypothetical protein